MDPKKQWALAALTLTWTLTALFAHEPTTLAAPAGQQPTFRSGVELVSIDATVVDGSGSPVTGLGADDFDVSVDGKRRRVVSAQFIDLSGSTSRPPAAAAPRAAFSSNDLDPAHPLPPPDRHIVLAVDHSSFLPGGGRQTLEAARRFLTRLDASDRVALVVYPDPGLFVPPTTDHAAIARALGRIAGSAERIEASHLELNLGLTEAIEIAAGDRSTFERVASRECSGTGAAADVDYCRAIIELDAPEMVAELRARTARSLNGLTGLLESLSTINGRKTLVLVSAGLAASAERPAMDIMAELKVASDKAARAETVIHALHVDTAVLDASGADRRRISTSARADAELMATGLEAVVDMNGGALFRVPAGSDPAFARIAREISAYYVLGIEPDATDRDGKPHAIKVRIQGRRSTIRHRQQFTIAKPSAADASPDETLATVLRAGQTLRDLPLRVSTQVLRDLTGNNVRVLVRADIGRGVATPAYLRVGLAVFNASGQPAGSTSSLRLFAPTSGPDASWPFQELVTLRPGSYTLRLAARDADGRVGSVTHAFDATLSQGHGARLSDLLVIDPDRGGEIQLPTTIDGRVSGPRLSTFVEVYPERGTSVSGVSFSVAAAGREARLVDEPGVMTDRPQDLRVVARANLNIRTLPPGDYIVTATAFDRTTTLGSVSRPISVLAPAAPVPASVAGGETPLAVAVAVAVSVSVPMAKASGGAASAIRPFDRGDVLRPDVVAFFLGRLHTEDPAGAAPAVTAAVTAAAAAAARGEFDAVLRELTGASDTSLSVAFLRGLARFGTGGVEAAAVQFRAALRTSPTFGPAAFYLGACSAAGGREEQAIEAWQSALLSDPEARVVYEVLADAWIRRGDGERAVAVLTTARERWPDDEGISRRLAAARAR